MINRLLVFVMENTVAKTKKVVISKCDVRPDDVLTVMKLFPTDVNTIVEKDIQNIIKSNAIPMYDLRELDTAPPDVTITLLSAILSTRYGMSKGNAISTAMFLVWKHKTGRNIFPKSYWVKLDKYVKAEEISEYVLSRHSHPVITEALGLLSRRGYSMEKCYKNVIGTIEEGKSLYSQEFIDYLNGHSK